MSDDPSKKNAECKYWQISFKDKHSLSGYSICSLINIIQSYKNYESVVVKDVQGAGSSLSQLRQYDTQRFPIKTNYLKEILKNIEQLDWGDFYFVDKEADVDGFDFDQSYSVTVALTPILLRAVDGAYFYIYTKYYEIMVAVKNHNPSADVALLEIQQLEFPD